MRFEPEKQPHRRYNPLAGEWVLVSPHRTKRPWQGQREAHAAADRPPHDPECYLCPGNARAGGVRNPAYTQTFVFPNDFAAMLPGAPAAPAEADEWFQPQPVTGECRVLCFSPRHDLSLPEMSLEGIRQVVETWSEQAAELGQRYRWVQVFENKGSAMGCSNPHPHGQIWAGDFLPLLPAKEDRFQADYFARTRRPLLVSYLEAELKRGERLVESNAHWVLLVPYWATWPFELLLAPRRSVSRLPDLTAIERQALADILQRGLSRYDNLFETSFPYSMGWHGAPTGPDAGEGAHWHLHAHFFPPLLRSATVKKFMVGYEMLAEPQRDLTPEQAAERLRAVPAAHYRVRPANS